VSNLQCPLYHNSSCVLKTQCVLPEFKVQHDCGGFLEKCSFFAKEKLKQVSVNSNLKIIIKSVSNVYLVKADALVYPTNDFLEIDDQLLNKMTLGESQKLFSSKVDKRAKIGFPYMFKCPSSWKIKQTYIINAVVGSETELVNEHAVQGVMKKTLLLADQEKIESLLVIPFDKGAHDISLISMAQLSSIFMLLQRHKFEYLKKIYICMEDEETEQSFIEYYNRIFGDPNERRNVANATVDN